MLCSGWTADEVAEPLRAEPQVTFLQKPFQAQALVDVLSRAIGRAAVAPS